MAKGDDDGPRFDVAPLPPFTAAATVAAAERRADATKGASDVQQTVSHMPDDDVDRELREKFTRPGSR